MEKLGLIDEMFYKADHYNLSSLIMAGASVLVPATDEARLDAEELASHLAARFEKVPPLRQRFVQDPLRLGSVHKVDDPDFNVWDHIDVTYLDEPGDHDQLEKALAEFLSEEIGLTGLWRWRVIGGLQGGRVAIANKIHHALTDGMGATEMMTSVFDSRPAALEYPDGTGPSDPRPIPTKLAMIARACVDNFDRMFVKTPRFIYRNARPILSSVRDLLDKRQSGESDGNSGSPPEVKPTSLNYVADRNNFRTLSYTAFSIDDLKTLARHFDCTINDICLLLFSCALQNYFDSTGEKIDSDLACMMPINVRDSGSVKGGNQITAARILLYNREPDLVERLKKISADTREAKGKARPQQAASSVDFDAMSELIFPTVLDLLFYLAGKIDLLDKIGNRWTYFNVFLTNMAGSREPLYLANGRIDQVIPMVPALPVIAVSPGIISQGGEVAFGFNCDRAVVKDPKMFTTGLEQGFYQLQMKLKTTGKGKRAATPRAGKTAAVRSPKKPGRTETDAQAMKSGKKSDSRASRKQRSSRRK